MSSFDQFTKRWKTARNKTYVEINMQSYPRYEHGNLHVSSEAFNAALRLILVRNRNKTHFASDVRWDENVVTSCDISYYFTSYIAGQRVDTRLSTPGQSPVNCFDSHWWTTQWPSNYHPMSYPVSHQLIVWQSLVDHTMTIQLPPNVIKSVMKSTIFKSVQYNQP